MKSNHFIETYDFFVASKDILTLFAAWFVHGLKIGVLKYPIIVKISKAWMHGLNCNESNFYIGLPLTSKLIPGASREETPFRAPLKLFQIVLCNTWKEPGHVSGIHTEKG